MKPFFILVNIILAERLISTFNYFLFIMIGFFCNPYSPFWQVCFGCFFYNICFDINNICIEKNNKIIVFLFIIIYISFMILPFLSLQIYIDKTVLHFRNSIRPLTFQYHMLHSLEQLLPQYFFQILL